MLFPSASFGLFQQPQYLVQAPSHPSQLRLTNVPIRVAHVINDSMDKLLRFVNNFAGPWQ